MTKVVKFPKMKQINIGLFIFGIIFIYLVASIIMYLTADHISVYEVRHGSILKDSAYTGLALRDETVLYAEGDGYLNYYIEDGSKVRAGSEIYTISNEELDLTQSTTSSSVEMSDAQKKAMYLEIQNSNKIFDESYFLSIYDLKDDLTNSLNRATNHSKSEQLKELISTNTYANISVKSTSKDGIVVYATDGMEHITVDSFSIEHLSKNGYKTTKLTGNSPINSGDAVCKIVTSDDWNILVKVSQETKDTLSKRKTVQVNFKKDNERLRANISFLENTPEPILCLSFYNSMIRYANERYLDIELILEDESGLKIPKSAETSKDFYIVPKSFLTQGGNNSSDGILKQTVDADGNYITEFMNVTVYYEEDEMIYLDPNLFKDGDLLLKPDSIETFVLKEKRSLKGVYCINKGYAVFRQIEILCESDDYYIVKEGSSFGLSNFDHIALDAKSLKENDVVF